MLKKTSMILALMTLFMSFAAHSVALNSGPWRFELQMSYARVPFIITLKNHQNKITGILHNGKEEIPLQNITMTKDQLSIPLLTYESSLELTIQKKDLMTGFLIRHNKNPVQKTPLVALNGLSERFPEKKSAPTIDLNGKWAVELDEDAPKKTPGVLVFEQEGNKLNGTLLTPTGDYRYFEGFVSKNEFQAASFDGSYNYLLKGKVKDKKLKASLRANYLTTIEGKHDPKAHLPDAYKETKVVKPLHFKFSDLQGKLISLDNEKFAGKPVILQIYGSWCPNCMDEMNYLIPWYNENHKRGVEIIALAFERSLSSTQAKMQLKKVQHQKNIPYTLLLAGSTAEDKPMDKLPGLKNFISFPTTIYLNKKHEVVKVYAGFNGPGTGEYYENWKKEFNDTVTNLLE